MSEKMTRRIAGMLAAVLAIAVGALAGAQRSQAALVTSGLVIQLDAGADTFSDHAGTTPATNGQAVANWGDQAALGGNQFAQINDANASRRPLLIENALNGRSVLQFDGVDDHLLMNAPVDGGLLDTDTISWFAVYKTAGNNQSLLRASSAARTNLWGSYAETDTFKSHSRTAGNSWIGATSPLQTDTFVALGAVWGADDTVRQWINGAHGTVGTGADNPNASFSRIRIGNHEGGNTYLSGEIAEILVYNKELTASQRNQVGYYLASKYGLATAYTPTSLRARWRLDEPSGATTAADSVSINDGTVQGASSGQPGPGGGTAYTFNGSSDYIDLSSHVANFAGLNEGTITGWFQTTGTGTHVILGASDQGDASSELRLFVEGNKLKYDVRGDLSSSGQLVSAADVNDGQWHHATITVGDSSRAKLYLDGQLVDTEAEPFFSAVFDLDQMAIGRNVDSGGPQWLFNGSLSDVAVYDVALSRGQVVTAMNQGAIEDPVNVLAHWEFDDKGPGGTTVNTERIADSSGHGRDAFAGGGATPPNFVAGAPLYGFTSALTFTSNRDSVIFRDAFGFGDGGDPAGSDINFDQNDSFTIEAVLRTEMSGAVGAIVAKDDAGDTPSWWLRLQTDGTLQAIVDDRNSPDPNVNGLVRGDVPINDGDWHHVAFVRDAEADEVRLYVDYVLDETGVDATLGTSFSDTKDIRIGESNGGGWQFIGDIDFVRISAGALAPEQFVQRVPEPASVLLLAAGAALLGLAGTRRRRWKR